MCDIFLGIYGTFVVCVFLVCGLVCDILVCVFLVCVLMQVPTLLYVSSLSVASCVTFFLVYMAHFPKEPYIQRQRALHSAAKSPTYLQKK